MRIVSLFLLCLAVVPAHARTYKCTDADGHIGYSQTPCAASMQQQALSSPASNAVSASACDEVAVVTVYLHDRFSRGGSGDSLIQQYGGVHGINPRFLNLLNYVSGFRFNPDVPASRVAQLATAKCQAGGFGAMQAGDLPIVDPEQGLQRQQRLARQQAERLNQAQLATVSVNYRDTPIEAALADLSAQAGIAIRLDVPIRAEVTMQLSNVPWQQVLTAIALSHDLLIQPGSDGLHLTPRGGNP